jgi:uncharacterized protein YbaR (Trm112 family)
MQDTSSTMQRCLTALACPACRAPIEAGPDASDVLRCSACNESFACRDDIWDFLKQDEDNTFDDESQQQAYYDEGAADTLESGRNIPCHYNKIDGILQAAKRVKRAGSLETICEVGVGTALHAAWFMQQMPEPAFLGIDLSHRVLMNGRSRWSQFRSSWPCSARPIACRWRMIRLTCCITRARCTTASIPTRRSPRPPA